MRTTRTLAALLIAAALILPSCTPSTESSGGSSAAATSSRNGDIPEFSNPTRITNSYLPFGEGGRWIYEGTKEGKPYLIEVAVTDETKTIEWNGNSTEAMVVRHRGWVKGVLIEEAFDYIAQGDDGGVWYFGEDVDNYKHGKLADHEGSWLAGVDGALPAKLMPKDPRVGEVFYSEDVVDLDIVERDKILSVTHPAATPEGPVDNGVLLGATQPDGTKEEKVFVPEVGEVLARSDEGEVRLVRRLPQNAESATEATFTEPRVVDNQYFGVTGVDYRLYLGVDEGEPIRIEVVPTGGTKTITWEGGSTEAVVSQFMETSERDLLEIATDWFAQDDSGNVWYFGEDVFNYEKGRVADNDGAWIAGADGPPGLIMPGDPALGQRFNPENIPGRVFETVDVQAVDASYRLATGERLGGVLQLHETLDDGTEEVKLYAAGYGNVSVEVPGVEIVDIVYALPNDSISSPAPAELVTMRSGLRPIGTHGTGSTERIGAALDTLSARASSVPGILIKVARGQLEALDEALRRGNREEARMGALDLEQTVLDIARLYQTDRPVDLDVIDLLARRMIAAAEAGDGAAAGTAAAMAKGVADRNVTTLPGRVIKAAAAADGAADKRDLKGLARAASKLRATLD